MPPKLPAIFLMDDEVFPLVYGAPERAQLASLVDFLAPPLSAASLSQHRGPLHGVEAVFSSWGIPTLEAELLDRLPDCRIIFHAAGTVRPFVTPFFWERGLRLTSAAEANAKPVAEYTFAAIIFCLKHVWQRLFELRARREASRPDPLMPGTFESTVGLLALSRTGRQVAARLRSLDVNVIAYDPVIDSRQAKDLGVELCTLDEIFRRADVVSCHLPLLPATTEMLRAAHFARMKPGAAFINTARGAVVHEAEMLSVFRERPDLFAVLDVVQNEPIASDSPLLGQSNLVVTPHLAGSLGSECRRLGQMMVSETRRYLAGEALAGEVFAADLVFSA